MILYSESPDNPMFNGLQEILATYDDRASLAEASTIPGPWYVDPRVAELEAAKVFSTTWQMVGRVDQVEKPVSL